MNKILSLALKEEEQRRKLTLMQINKLIEIVKNRHNNSDIDYIENIKNTTLKSLAYDIDMISKLNVYIKSNELIKNNTTFALKYNKNFQLFNYAYDLISKNLVDILQGDIFKQYKVDVSTKTYLGGLGEDVKGTSFLNYLQISLFTILYSNQGINNITEIEVLNKYNIYNVTDSPNIQTTKLPANFNYTEINTDFKKWIYYYSDQYSPIQGELLFFTLGFSYGGSREDERYDHKLFKTHDCSSAIAKWTNSSVEFSTSHLEELFYDECVSLECLAADKVLSPISKELALVKGGEVVIIREYNIESDINMLNRSNSKWGHAGIVTEVYLNENCFELLSYNRDVPEIEGLGFTKLCMDDTDNKKYMFFSIKNDYVMNNDKVESNGIQPKIFIDEF